MYKFFGLFIGLLSAMPLTAQIQLGPFVDNPAARLQTQQEAEALRLEIEAFTGKPFQPGGSEKNDCPEFEFMVNYVFEGEDLLITVDTFALGGGQGSSITLTDCQPLDFGTVALDTTTLRYEASAGVTGGRDTVCVEFCNQDGDCEIFEYPIVVKRRGTTYITDEVLAQAEEFLPEVCVDESLLPGDLFCNQFLDCPDTYDGEGQQVIYWTQYAVPTSCFRYVATRFAGVDTVCLILCDDFTVCDTFKVPMRIQSDTLGLPFFDDFSYRGPYPSATYWLDRDAFVNNTLAGSPPSVGFATLDGLNRGGSPYSNSGQADRLTSKYINLSGTGDDVVLRFFIAPKGFGLYPNASDSLVLQFRNNQGIWKSVAFFDGISENIPIDSVPDFQFQSIPITDAQYKYNGFQFRFINYVTPVGIYDLWHVDYVRLAAGEGSDDTFQDLAFTQTPPRLLKNYVNMPWSHLKDFVDQEISPDELPSFFYNHTEQAQNPSATSRILLRELESGFDFPINLNVTDAQNVPPKEDFESSKALGSEFGVITNALKNNFNDAEKLNLEMEYQFQLNNQELRNDTVRYQNILDNYFAYDDGTAESYIFFDNPQNENPLLAVRYTSNIEDTLRGVRIHFPHVNGNVENQLFNLYIYVGGLDEDPAYEGIFKSPLYASSKLDTLQGFTTYVLENLLKEPTPVPLPEGVDFYIAFQQVTTTNDGIPIGFDLNNDFEDAVFVNVVGDWEPIPDNFNGSPMIRAVVGDETPISTAVEEAPIPMEPQARLNVFPNPSSGVVRVVFPQEVNAGNCLYQLLNQFGQPVRQGQACQEINLSGLAPGIYFLQVQHPELGQFPVEKLIFMP